MYPQFLAIDASTGHKRVQACLYAKFLLGKAASNPRLLEATLEDPSDVGPSRHVANLRRWWSYEIRNFALREILRVS